MCILTKWVLLSARGTGSTQQPGHQDVQEARRVLIGEVVVVDVMVAGLCIPNLSGYQRLGANGSPRLDGWVGQVLVWNTCGGRRR